jgi:hypothetical protein
MRSPYSNPEDYYAEDCELIVCFADKFLSLEKWGFKKNIQFLGSTYQAWVGRGMIGAVVIYDSEWCRLRFSVDREETLYVYYGRLHAPNNAWVMNWMSKDCNCWHDYHFPLQFLDGVSPHLADSLYLNNKINEYLVSDEYRNITGHFERVMKKHALIWEEYGQRFFELFDVRSPHIWDDYTHFMSEYCNQNLDSRSISPDNPLRDKIC